ncbi:MAG TPA: phage holin family protein [Candidatus Saccharibacteria bacterium]|nr:phage holin family protein [Candidatus Saccharibacteria bacterium]HMR38449.1 phage holin family protein [Candidatus Saccharibacteria bacterium]
MRFMIQTVLLICGNALGLLAAALLVTDFRIDAVGFIVSVLFFTLMQVLLAPFVLKMAIKYAPAFRGGIALVTTFVVLLLTVAFTSGLQISSLVAWIIAPLIIWLVSVLAGILLPMVLFKKALAQQRGK